MPVHIAQHGDEYCVEEPDGTVVDSGCYSDREDALRRMRAMNANMEKSTNVENISVTLEPQAYTSGDQSPDTVPVTTTNVSDEYVYVIPESGTPIMRKKDSSKEQVEKFGEMYAQFPPTSFAELDEIREAQKQDMSVQKVISDFMALVGNVMNFPSEKGRMSDLKDLIKEMQERFPIDEEEDGEDSAQADSEDGEEEKEDNNAEVEKTNRLFTIWKDDSTGEYMWLGVYSNKFRDNDSPAEILAEKAHLRFIERVEKGELEYPDLYIWHIPVPVGKATLLAYDNAGFSIASGIVEEPFAVALMNSTEDLAMSHGMPSKYIRRDDVDKTVITDYVSTEVSVLPRYAAANKMTDFYVLDEEEAKMAIIPENKRQQVADFLGDSKALEELESRLSLQSDKALADGIEFKEENEAEAPNEELIEADGEKTEQPEAEVKEELEESVAEAEDVAEESVESDAGVAEVIAAEDGEVEVVATQAFVEKEELAETLATIVSAVTKHNEQILEAVTAIGKRVDALENGVGELKEADDTKIAQLAANTPELSLMALLAGRLSDAKTVIGNPATLVKESSKLANEGPLETPHNEEETKEGYAGLFFSGWQR